MHDLSSRHFVVVQTGSSLAADTLVNVITSLVITKP